MGKIPLILIIFAALASSVGCVSKQSLELSNFQLHIKEKELSACKAELDLEEFSLLMEEYNPVKNSSYISTIATFHGPGSLASCVVLQDSLRQRGGQSYCKRTH